MKEPKRKIFTFENIQNIELEETPLGNHWLSFTVENCHYDMEVNQESDGERLIYHREARDADNCSFCSNEHSKCEVLTEKNEAIFNYLIQHPSIRLKWIVRKQ